MKVLLADIGSLTAESLTDKLHTKQFYTANSQKDLKKKISSFKPDIVLIQERIFAYLKNDKIVINHLEIFDIIKSADQHITWVYLGNSFESLDHSMDKKKFADSIGVQYVFIKPFNVYDIAAFINELS